MKNIEYKAELLNLETARGIARAAHHKAQDHRNGRDGDVHRPRPG